MSRRPLRLLMTADAVGGVWQYAADLARALRPLGIETVIALLGPAPTPGQRAELGDIRLIETGLPLDWLCDGPTPVLAAGEAVAALAAAERVDIVQLNMPTLLAEARFPCPVVAVTHGCVATWWAAARATPLSPAYRWHERLTARGLARADRVVAPSAAYGAIVARHYDLPRPATVPNGRRPLRVVPGARHDCVFTAGRLWDEVKNARTLDAVAARLAVPFHAAGAAIGPHGETITLQHLHPLGLLDEAGIAARLAPRPIFVSAATFEPFGLAVLEAAAAGCALVLSDIPTFRELWSGAALFVDPHDEDGFVAAIDSLIGDDRHRVEAGEAARAAAGRYTPAAMAAGMAALIRGLLPTRARAAAA
ncbi:glycosyltransferase family 4 protein [Sphingomonas morindae]|uniref:Glycosyltransferase family 4 protein n=1 Tax=Sphingomonas morindae TaxID=1541170 RepID=A0ABY4XA82_9SPHN|nr:glycosyltransferase family 4 protein [Sphingomonas morindae]USI73852.1 glycosyltransferase family 4 protein [Sphingomonas morindae]